jgi:hypothetical protein
MAFVVALGVDPVLGVGELGQLVRLHGHSISAPQSRDIAASSIAAIERGYGHSHELCAFVEAQLPARA